MINRSLLLGAAIDLLLLVVFCGCGIPFLEAQSLAYLLGWFGFYCFNPDLRSLLQTDRADGRCAGVLELAGVAVGIFAVRGGLAASLTMGIGLPAFLAGFLAIALCLALHAVTPRILAVCDEHGVWFPFSAHGIGWLVGILFVLRVFYLHGLDLLPEEAYYWQYANHLDIGYLDHPPMVGWLIALGQALFGHNAFAVRLPALACWCVSAFFVHRLALKLTTPAGAAASVLLLSVFPYYFLNGLFISPDAPLMVCWSALLYFFHSALVEERRAAWLGIGFFMGAGILSKYTIALTGVAGLVFILSMPSKRRLLLRPEPYASVLVALLVCSPVIYWNYAHNWASFTFQSSRRLQSSVHFAPHILLLNALYLATPLGVWEAFRVLSNRRTDGSRTDPAIERFVLCFAGVPFAVFGLYSLRHVPKINWIGPAFTVLLPFISLRMLELFRGERPPSENSRMALGWVGTVAGVLILFGAIFAYAVAGLPGLSYPSAHRFLGWKNLASEVVRRADEYADRTGTVPAVIGMDKHNISSQLAFYMPTVGGRNQLQVGGRSLFDQPGLMYAWWSPPASMLGRNLLLVGKLRKELSEDIVGVYFDELGPIEEYVATHHGHPIHRYYIRFGRGYHASRPHELDTEADGDDE